eukprot:TRINITY_DN13605_c1_g2_i1.p1 TRINITY_DN13605_c1_g2~~TRINITY_DN13605_c1_g2_i1.p1  ORF type:complete len:294 (+),score=39.99 TRINITY_DN13605_c1_g2_i1:231-1112(+)
MSHEEDVRDKIWVGGLPPRIDEDVLADKFSEFGKIKSILIKRSEKDTFAFIRFDRPWAARKAIHAMDQSSEINNGNGRIKVSMAAPTRHDGRPATKHEASSRELERRSRSFSGGQDRRRDRSRSIRREVQGKAGGGGKDKEDVRPGDWRCPSCNGNVFASKDACFRCGTLKPRNPRSSRVNQDVSKQDGTRVNRGDSASAGLKHVAKNGFMVRVQNLPDDMEELELSDIGSDFGTVVEAKVWRYDGIKFGKLIYDFAEDAVTAVCALHGRRVDGSGEKLKAQIPCKSCGQTWF